MHSHRIFPARKIRTGGFSSVLRRRRTIFPLLTVSLDFLWGGVYSIRPYRHDAEGKQDRLGLAMLTVILRGEEDEVR
jgi:hypothetical protein